VLVVLNFTPVPRMGYRLGVSREGHWAEALNSDAAPYGGQGFGNYGGADTEAVPAHGHPQSLVLTLPPLGALFLTPPA
jgi:1,4-alpha-glucan branching enzyme